jgi:spermidine synthase
MDGKSMTSARRAGTRARRAAAAIPSIEISEEGGVRYLHFGSRWIQGAMRVRRAHALELEYTRDMMFPLLLHPRSGWPSRVLLIGLGAASVTKFLYRYRPRAAITVVEIEPRVVAAARQHFALPESSRLHLEVADGAAYIARPGPPFDLIAVDGFDALGLAGALDTRAFYRHCRARLTHDGMLVTNLLRRSRGCEASVARIAEAFDGRVLALPACESGNTVALAATGPPLSISVEALRRAATVLREGTGLNLGRTIGRLAAAGVAPTL